MPIHTTHKFDTFEFGRERCACGAWIEDVQDNRVSASCPDAVDAATLIDQQQRSMGAVLKTMHQAQDEENAKFRKALSSSTIAVEWDVGTELVRVTANGGYFYLAPRFIRNMDNLPEFRRRIDGLGLYCSDSVLIAWHRCWELADSHDPKEGAIFKSDSCPDGYKPMTKERLPDPKLIERVSRAMCKADGNDPDAKCLRRGMTELVHLGGLGAGARYAPQDLLLVPAWSIYVPAAETAILELEAAAMEPYPLSPGTADMSMDWNQKIIAAVREFERGRIVLDGYDYSIAPIGEPFIKIVTGEVVAEGEDEPFSSTPEDAIQRWFDGATKWAEDKSGTLYWRVRPSVECSYDGRWKVYSRLLISDKPVIDGVIDVAKEEASRLCKSREELLQLPSTPMYHDFKVRRDRFRQDNKDGIGLHSVSNPMPGDEQIEPQNARVRGFDEDGIAIVEPSPKDLPLIEALKRQREKDGF